MLALAPLALLALGGWLVARARSRAVRADVKRLALLACVVIVAAFLLAAAPFSSVPACSPLGGEASFGSGC